MQGSPYKSDGPAAKVSGQCSSGGPALAIVNAVSTRRRVSRASECTPTAHCLLRGGSGTEMTQLVAHCPLRGGSGTEMTQLVAHCPLRGGAGTEMTQLEAHCPLRGGSGTEMMVSSGAT
jgi:hypothetical protein